MTGCSAGCNKAALAREFGVTRQTIYNLLTVQPQSARSPSGTQVCSPMPTKPTLAMDTSALNWLAKEADPEPIISPEIVSGYAVRIPEMTFGEAIATSKPEVRLKLMDVCRRLVASGSCITAAHWLLDQHVKRFHDDPGRYSWRNVPSRLFLLEEEMLSGRYYADEALVAEQAAEMSRLQDEFEDCFPKSTRTTPLPSSFADWLVECRVKGGSFWNTARGLYSAASRFKDGLLISRSFSQVPDDAVLESFLSHCPPVRAIVYAFELTHYDRSLRRPNAMSFKAGRNDQMMAIYLPYCDFFLTNDGSQHRCLSEVASSADIPVKIQLYGDFAPITSAEGFS